MRIVIIGAMQKEIDFLIERIDSCITKEHYKYIFYEGKLFDKDVVIVKSGIGKVASGMLVSDIVNYYKDIDLIINIGVSGGISGKVNIGDIVVADKLKHADVDVTIFENYVYGQIPNAPAYFPTNIDLIKNLDIEIMYSIGGIISGDQFYNKEKEVNELINSHFSEDNILCLDMESAALAHSSWFYDIDYLAIRAISDLIGSDFQDNQYNENLELACLNSNKFLLKVLEKI